MQYVIISLSRAEPEPGLQDAAYFWAQRKINFKWQTLNAMENCAHNTLALSLSYALCLSESRPLALLTRCWYHIFASFIIIWYAY